MKTKYTDHAVVAHRGLGQKRVVAVPSAESEHARVVHSTARCIIEYSLILACNSPFSTSLLEAPAPTGGATPTGLALGSCRNEIEDMRGCG